MKKFFTVIIGLGNWFLRAFMCYKIYTYFSSEVGFNLPDLTYLNIYALTLIIGIWNSNVHNQVKINEMYKKTNEDSDNLVSVLTVSMTYLLVILFGWILKIILF